MGNAASTLTRQAAQVMRVTAMGEPQYGQSLPMSRDIDDQDTAVINKNNCERLVF
jgi:hypothetical protein